MDIDKKNDMDLDGEHKYSVPIFVKDTVNGTIANKVGDIKTWNKILWYYCNFTNHCNDMRWHTHKATDCKPRLRHVQSNASPPASNLANDELPNKEPFSDQPFPTDDGNDITSLLAPALNTSGNNTELQEKISMALSASNLMCLLCRELTKNSARYLHLPSIYLSTDSPLS